MAKFTKIDQDACIACGACIGEAPDVYSEGDGGIAFSLLDDNAGTTEVPADLEDDVNFAMESCPVDAVLVQDSSF